MKNSVHDNGGFIGRVADYAATDYYQALTTTTANVSSSAGYDLNNATYDNVSSSAITQDAALQDLSFSSDGTKMYICGRNNDTIYQYTLSTAWNVSTALYANKSYYIGGQEDSLSDIFFKADGSKFYIIGYVSDQVHQYSLSTAWDISTASYDNLEFSVSSQEDNPRGLTFKPDGTKMFQSVACYHDPSLKDKYKNVIGFHQLAKPWDVGTTDFLQQEKLNDIIYCDEKYSELRALHPEHPDMRICGLTFRPDGMGFYFAYVLYSLTSQDLEYYLVQQDLTVPWELSSAKDDYKYSGKITHGKAPVDGSNSTTESVPHIWQINGMTVSPNGRFIHAVYPHNYTINRAKNDRSLAHPRQFEMTTPWDISTAGMDNMYEGIGWHDQSSASGVGQHPGHEEHEPTAAVHWNESGEQCWFSYVPECSPGGKHDPITHLAGCYKANRFTLNKATTLPLQGEKDLT